MKRLYKAWQSKQDIVYLDETGFEATAARTHGWAPIGQKIYGEISGNKRPRTSLVAGLLRGELIAPMLFDGTCDTDVFNAWLEAGLLPKLKPGTVIILDNAAFHKSPRTVELVHAAGCTLLFLPPYSPHLNPIENRWAVIKNAWKFSDGLSLDAAVQSCRYLFK